MTEPERPTIFDAFLRDIHRRTEPPNGVIRLIIAYKAVSAVLLFCAAFFLLGLIANRDLSERVREVVVLMGLKADNRFIGDTLIHLGLLGKRTTTALGITSLLYGLLETTEVAGLLNQRRWAEYLVLVATVLFLPYECLELAIRATGGKLLIFIVNVAIAVYLVRSKRLFQDSAAFAAEAVESAEPEASARQVR